MEKSTFEVRRVLFVDDNRDEWQYALEELASRDVVAVASFTEALERLRAESFDLVIADNVLHGEETGRDLILKLWEEEAPRRYALVSRGFPPAGGVLRMIANTLPPDVIVLRTQARCYREILRLVEAGESWPVGEQRRRRFANIAENRYQYVLSVVEACGGNKAEAARQLEIDRSTLTRILKRGGEEQTA